MVLFTHSTKPCVNSDLYLASEQILGAFRASSHTHHTPALASDENIWTDDEILNSK